MSCLIIKLTENVENEKLPVIGALNLKVVNTNPSPSASTQGIVVLSTAAVEVEVIGDGYITNSALTANLGKKKAISANVETAVYFYPGTYNVKIKKKYGVTQFRNTAGGALLSNANRGNVIFDLHDLDYSGNMVDLVMSYGGASGDISALSMLSDITRIDIRNNELVIGDVKSLKNLTGIEQLFIANTGVIGDISGLEDLTALKYLDIKNTEISGDISGISDLTALLTLVLNRYVSGNLSSLSGMTSMKNFTIENNNAIAGNISSMASVTGIERINILNCPQITGDISSLGSNASLKTIDIRKTNISGDVSALNGIHGLYKITAENLTLSYSGETERSTSDPIISLQNYPNLGDDVDKYLIDMAPCAAYSGSDTYAKTIQVSGNRTSASDSAITTLQGKGYTVSVSS